MENEELIELIEKKHFEVLNRINDCFEENTSENAGFFNNILDLIKAEIKEDKKQFQERLEKVIERLEKSTEINKVITDELLCELKEIKINEEDKECNQKVIYKDIKKGIKQYSIQMGITFLGILIILGGYQLIKLFIL